jgi:hypothetical protein
MNLNWNGVMLDLRLRLDGNLPDLWNLYWAYPLSYLLEWGEDGYGL